MATGWRRSGGGAPLALVGRAGLPISSLSSFLEASVTPFLNSLMPRPTLRPMAGSRLAPKSTTIAMMTQIHSGPGIAQLLRIVTRWRTLWQRVYRLLSLIGGPGAPLRQAGGVLGGLLRWTR